MFNQPNETSKISFDIQRKFCCIATLTTGNSV